MTSSCQGNDKFSSTMSPSRCQLEQFIKEPTNNAEQEDIICLASTLDDLPDDVIARCLGEMLNPMETCHLSMCSHRLNRLFPSPLVIQIVSNSNGSYLRQPFFVSRAAGTEPIPNARHNPTSVKALISSSSLRLTDLPPLPPVEDFRERAKEDWPSPTAPGPEMTPSSSMLHSTDKLQHNVQYYFWSFDYERNNRVYLERQVRITDYKEINGNYKYGYTVGLAPATVEATSMSSLTTNGMNTNDCQENQTSPHLPSKTEPQQPWRKRPPQTWKIVPTSDTHNFMNTTNVMEWGDSICLQVTGANPRPEQPDSDQIGYLSATSLGRPGSKGGVLWHVTHSTWTCYEETLQIVKSSEFEPNENDPLSNNTLENTTTDQSQISQMGYGGVVGDEVIEHGPDFARMRSLVVGEMTPMGENVEVVDLTNVVEVDTDEVGENPVMRVSDPISLTPSRYEHEQEDGYSTSETRFVAKDLDIHPVPNVCDNGFCFLYSPEQLRHGSTKFDGAHAHVPFYFWTLDGIMYFHALVLPFCLGIPIVQDDDPIFGKSQASPLLCLYDTYSARWGCLKYYLATAADVSEGRPLDMERFLLHVTDHEDHTVVQQRQQRRQEVQQQQLRPSHPEQHGDYHNAEDELPVARQRNQSPTGVDADIPGDDTATVVAVSASNASSVSLVYIQVCKVRHPIRRTEPNFPLDKSRVWEFVLC